MKQFEKVIKQEVIKVLRRDTTSRGYNELRVVCWNDRSPVLEKRQVIVEPNGTESMGRVRGFNESEFAFLVAHEQEVYLAFREGKARANPKR